MTQALAKQKFLLVSQMKDKKIKRTLNLIT